MKVQLTDRQLEIAALTADGKSIKDTASKLSLHPGTIATHRKLIAIRLRQAFNLPHVGMVEITHFAIANGLIPLKFWLRENSQSRTAASRVRFITDSDEVARSFVLEFISISRSLNRCLVERTGKGIVIEVAVDACEEEAFVRIISDLTKKKPKDLHLVFSARPS